MTNTTQTSAILSNLTEERDRYTIYDVTIAEVVVESTILLLISTVAFTANASLWLVILTSRDLKTESNVLILCLSLADLLVAVVGAPITLSSIISSKWLFSRAVCTFNGYLNMLTFVASVQSLGAISVNRYFKICRPAKYLDIYTYRNVGFMFLGVWVYSGILSIPPLVGWASYDFLPLAAICFCDWSKSASYAVFMILMCFCVPCSAMIVCYVAIIKAFLRSRRTVQAFAQSVKKPRQAAPSASVTADYAKSASYAKAKASTRNPPTQPRSPSSRIEKPGSAGERSDGLPCDTGGRAPLPKADAPAVALHPGNDVTHTQGQKVTGDLTGDGLPGGAKARPSVRWSGDEELQLYSLDVGEFNPKRQRPASDYVGRPAAPGDADGDVRLRQRKASSVHHPAAMNGQTLFKDNFCSELSAESAAVTHSSTNRSRHNQPEHKTKEKTSLKDRISGIRKSLQKDRQKLLNSSFSTNDSLESNEINSTVTKDFGNSPCTGVTDESPRHNERHGTRSPHGNSFIKCVPEEIRNRGGSMERKTDNSDQTVIVSVCTSGTPKHVCGEKNDLSKGWLEPGKSPLSNDTNKFIIQTTLTESSTDDKPAVSDLDEKSSFLLTEEQQEEAIAQINKEHLEILENENAPSNREISRLNVISQKSFSQNLSLPKTNSSLSAISTHSLTPSSVSTSLESSDYSSSSNQQIHLDIISNASRHDSLRDKPSSPTKQSLRLSKSDEILHTFSTSSQTDTITNNNNNNNTSNTNNHSHNNNNNFLPLPRLLSKGAGTLSVSSPNIILSSSSSSSSPQSQDPMKKRVKKAIHSQKRTREEFQLSASLLVVILIFIICWFPYCISMFVSITAPTKSTHSLDMTSLLLGYMNSCVNPIVYGLMNRRFKKGYKHLFAKCLQLLHLTDKSKSKVAPMKNVSNSVSSVG